MTDIPSHADFLDLLAGFAELGEPCPSVRTLSRQLDISPGAVQSLFDELRACGTIAWRVHHCGDRVGKRRVVTFLATGLRTALPGQRRPCEDDDVELEQAKTALRRRGFVVYDAWVTDGEEGKGLVRVDHQRLDRDAVLALAQALQAPAHKAVA